MARNDVGNSPDSNTDIPTVDLSSDTEFDALFDEIAEEFGMIDTSAGDDYAALDAALVGTEFERRSGESASSGRILAIADGDATESGDADQAEIFGFIRRRAEKKAKEAFRKLEQKIRSARKYARCIPALLKVIAAIKARRWGTAIKEALATWRCIRSA